MTYCIEKAIKRAEAYCETNGSRLTEKRKMLLTALIQSNKALSAYELVELYKNQYSSNITAMSVYRILEFLEAEKLVHKLNLVNKFVACSHIHCSDKNNLQQFLICVACGKVKEISGNPLMVAELENNINKSGFQLDKRQLEINCLCENCITEVGETLP